MAVSRENQIGMNLIRDDKDMMAQTDITDPRQLFAAPDAADRIVRTAQNIELDLRPRGLGFQIRKVQFIMIVCQNQWILYDLAVIGGDRRAEGRIDWRCDHHAVAGLRKSTNHHLNSGYDTGSRDKPGTVRTKAVAAFHPILNGLIVGVCCVRIAEDRSIQIGLESIDDFRRILQFHIRDGKGNDASRNIRVPTTHSVHLPEPVPVRSIRVVKSYFI